MVPGRHVEKVPRTATDVEEGERAFRRAKTSLWLFAASFLASFALFVLIWRTAGYTLLFATGSEHGGVAPSPWVGRGIWLLLTAVYASPEIVVVHYARQAARAGRSGWKIPVVAGAILAGFLPLMNLWLLIG
jgi:hypothetical protein